MSVLAIDSELETPLAAIRPLVESQGTHIITVSDDGNGAYMSLHNLDSTFDLEPYSNLALAVIEADEDTADYDNITSYRWVFWVSQGENITIESELTADANQESVLLFLANCLSKISVA